jgi:hypothetical protein
MEPPLFVMLSKHRDLAAAKAILPISRDSNRRHAGTGYHGWP